MLSYGHNGAISMDATFGTNDMKFHLFTLMGFDDHHMGVLLAWIITFSYIISQMKRMAWLSIPNNHIKFEIILKAMIY